MTPQTIAGYLKLSACNIGAGASSATKWLKSQQRLWQTGGNEPPVFN